VFIQTKDTPTETHSFVDIVFIQTKDTPTETHSFVDIVEHRAKCVIYIFFHITNTMCTKDCVYTD